MTPDRSRLELLAPARSAEIGIEAVNHGADAVYLGGPAFGARAAAGNPVADIARLAAYAHRYGARVYATLNTLLTDDELPAARRLVGELYDAGVDALIAQDMALTDPSFPPIALHASTQCDNRTPAKVKFLEDCGFSQVVLARELSLDEIRAVARATTARLEVFVHGALCVGVSGRCYLSHALTGRSANRGECAQPCRLPGVLKKPDGSVLARDSHLLCLKDLNRSASLGELIDAGVSAFKIEGRLKDLAYVKNVTAFYRRALDRELEGRPACRKSSSGVVRFFFEPDPAKTFQRGFTEFFLHGGGGDVTSFATPKCVGEPVGEVLAIQGQALEVCASAPLHNGDGLTYFNSDGALEGFRVNKVEKSLLHPGQPVKGLRKGTRLFRNHDQAFEQLLSGKTAERRVRVDLLFAPTPEGFIISITDEEGNRATVSLDGPREPARDAGRARAELAQRLAKLGNTMFEAGQVRVEGDAVPFLPAAEANALRREAVEALERARLAAWRRPARAPEVVPPVPHPEPEGAADHAWNALGRDFFARHGAEPGREALERGGAPGGEVPLMLSKHCLRRSFSLCPRNTPGVEAGPLLLELGGRTLRLDFDCKRCEMRLGVPGGGSGGGRC